LGYNWGFWGTMPQLLEDSNEALGTFNFFFTKYLDFGLYNSII
jgi:hypothetical protein